MSTYDYFIAGRTRNRAAIKQVLEAVRQSGKTAYCFIEHEYDSDGIRFDASGTGDAEAEMRTFEQITDWQTNPTFRKIFENDMQALRDSDALLLVFPAGLSAHMELGAAYGMGKKCYAIGAPEKPETLYMMFDGIFSNVEEFIDTTAGVIA
jgi:hypothetical protein